MEIEKELLRLFYLFVEDSFVAVIISVEEVGSPVRRQRGVVNSKAVILRRDVSLASCEIHHRLVLATVTKLQFVGVSASSQSKQLISQTDPKNWLTNQGKLQNNNFFCFFFFFVFLLFLEQGPIECC